MYIRSSTLLFSSATRHSNDLFYLCFMSDVSGKCVCVWGTNWRNRSFMYRSFRLLELKEKQLSSPADNREVYSFHASIYRPWCEEGRAGWGGGVMSPSFVFVSQLRSKCIWKWREKKRGGKKQNWISTIVQKSGKKRLACQDKQSWYLLSCNIFHYSTVALLSYLLFRYYYFFFTLCVLREI